jgi:hypothetical protein
MKAIIADSKLIAYCGLYCGACKSYLKGRCWGCAKNEKATWCKIRTCCAQNNYASCASCVKFGDVAECKKFNNFISKVFAFLFGSNRKGCIGAIKEKGLEGYAKDMAGKKLQSLKK